MAEEPNEAADAANEGATSGPERESAGAIVAPPSTEVDMSVDDSSVDVSVEDTSIVDVEGDDDVVIGDELPSSRAETARSIPAAAPTAPDEPVDEPTAVFRRPEPAAITGASQLPPASVDTIEAVAGAIERLRAEVAATGDATRRARLLYEAGEIQERAGDEPGAARDYLAAYNADTDFREPLEGLVRLLERRRTLANLGQLIEALVSAASSDEERARALTQRATFAADVQSDLEGARAAAREATETGAAAADTGPAWLALELVAAKLGDVAEREAALVGRADVAGDAEWRGLLLASAARIAAEAGELDRALELCERARTAGGPAVWIASRVAEGALRSDPGLPGSDEARLRQARLAAVLEARAELVVAALGTSADGVVPQRARRVDLVADLHLRAASSWRAAGDATRAATALDRALDVIEAGPAEDEPTNTGLRGAREAIEQVVLTARIRAAESVGDTALAASLSERRLIGETDGGVAASLAMRVAEHAASEGDLARALDALTRANTRDPRSAPARALTLDLLEGGDDGARFAEEVEQLADQCTTDDGKARALLLAAHAWTTRARDGARARAALAKAQAHGTPAETVARLGRSFASLLDDTTWYESATRALLAEEPAADAAHLATDLARLGIARGDEDGVRAAIDALRRTPEGAATVRALDAFAGGAFGAGDDAAAASKAAVDALAADAEDDAARRLLATFAAARAAGTSPAETIERLGRLAEEDPRDVLVTTWLVDLLLTAGDTKGAAKITRSAAEALGETEPEHAAARWLETALLELRTGDRAAALAAFEAAAELAPDAGGVALAWARRALSGDDEDLAARRATLEGARQDATITLERFAVEATAGDVDEAGAALASLEIASHDAVRSAAALARLSWAPGAAEGDALGAALQALELTGPTGAAAAAAERLRLAREGALDDALDAGAAAETMLRHGGGAAAALEWLAASIGRPGRSDEARARRALGDELSGGAREALHASAALLEARSDALVPLGAGTSDAVRLANLELAPPGCDPRRRATALAELGGALGDDAAVDAASLAGWSALAVGDAETALDLFRSVTASRADDLGGWEGMRSAAEAKADRETYAVSCEQLGARCRNDARAAAFWEQAALAWAHLGDAFDGRSEAALEASFDRDPTRKVAFDRLFRRVRDRKDGPKLLGLIERRLAVSDDATEIAKLYWEQARVLREAGDPEGALEALAHVTTFDEQHVGALALTGEIYIRSGRFEEAAEHLTRLAVVENAPPKNRVTAGVTAVDLYENKLGRHDLALDVLLKLHAAKLTTLPVRERLARAAARTGSWDEATRILEELMLERETREGRIDAARLAMAIHRDRRNEPGAALLAATKLLDEAPADGEALDLVVGLAPSLPPRAGLLARGRDALMLHLHEHPSDHVAYARLGRIAEALGDRAIEQSAFSCALALAGPDGITEQRVARLASQKPRVPQVALEASMLRQILAPGDDGPIAELFVALGPTLTEALGPTLAAIGVTKKDRVDARAGLPLRNEIAAWAGAFGIGEFELYIGGKDPAGVLGVPAETPALVVGPAINAPLPPAIRGRVAREILAIVRGTSVTRTRDDTTIAAIVVAACNLTKVKIAHPPFAVLAEVERQLGKAMSSKTKKAIEPLCRAIAASNLDARAWAARARASHARAAALGSGDVTLALADVLGEQVPDLPAVCRDDLRAHDLFRFALSRPFVDARRALGLEG